MSKVLGRWLLVLFNAANIGCDNHEADYARIQIKSATQPNAVVKISSYNGLDLVTVYETKTDSIGGVAFEIALQKPIFALIQIGDKHGEVYLSSGDDLIISEVGQSYSIPLQFLGRGSQVNNYVSWINSNVERVKWANGKGLYGLNDNEFQHRFDSLKNVVNAFHSRYIDSVGLDSDEISMLEYKNSIKVLGVREEFRFYKANISLNQKWEAHRKGEIYHEGPKGNGPGSGSDDIPFDPRLLTDGFGDYRMLLNFYWRNAISLPVSEALLASDTTSYHLVPVMTNALIRKGDYPEPIREFLFAYDLQQWLMVDGITPEIKSVFADFQTSYEKSDYLPALNRIYNEWLSVAPGKPAPAFGGITTTGDKVSITDFKGKIVYVDVWATWCGPCIAEIPAAKKLHQKFVNEHEVLFLNVSVDNNKSDWESFLNKDKEWKGLHLIVEPDKVQSLYADYKLFGVPAYILIDQSGNIVNVRAPRPSEGKVETEIRTLLKSYASQ